jgi:hypothetical protein
LDFTVDTARDRIWTPQEAEQDLRERELGAWRRWLEDDCLVYLLSPPVTAGADLGWDRGSGTVVQTLDGGAFIFRRTMVMREVPTLAPQTIEARLVAFQTSAQLVAYDDELQRSQRGS